MTPAELEPDADQSFRTAAELWLNLWAVRSTRGEHEISIGAHSLVW